MHTGTHFTVMNIPRPEKIQGHSIQSTDNLDLDLTTGEELTLHSLQRCRNAVNFLPYTKALILSTSIVVSPPGHQSVYIKNSYRTSPGVAFAPCSRCLLPTVIQGLPVNHSYSIIPPVPISNLNHSRPLVERSELTSYKDHKACTCRHFCPGCFYAVEHEPK